jgi:hypothetical protein
MNLDQLEAKAKLKQQKNPSKQTTSGNTPVVSIVQQAINETIGIKDQSSNKTADGDQNLLEKIDKYEAEIQSLKLTISMNEKSFSPTKNQEKILTAIRNEVINQNKGRPVVTRSMFIKTYRVSSRLLDNSLKDLLTRNIITRSKVIYAGSLATFAYEIID